MNDAILGIVHYCESHGPTPIFITKTSRSLPSRVPSSLPTCVLCQTISEETGYFVSEDKLAAPSLYFLSSTPSLESEGHHERLLKHVAVRATSIEGFRDVISGNTDLEKGGPLLIGDQLLLGGRTLFAFTFSLRDAASRGHKRIYSIFILLRDHFWLLQFLNNIYSHFKEIVIKFQTRANKLFDPNDSSKVKDLSHLLGEENLYLRIHRQFIGLLRSIGKNFKDTIYYGLPLEDIYASKVQDVSLTNPQCCLKTMFNQLEIQNQRVLIYQLLTNRVLKIHSSDDSSSLSLSFFSLLVPTGEVRVKSGSLGDIIDGDDYIILILHQGKMKVVNQMTPLPSPTPVLIQRVIHILKKNTLSDKMIQKRLMSLREEIFGLSKVFNMIHISSNEAKLRTLFKSMNLTYSDKEILEVWSQYLNK